MVCRLHMCELGICKQEDYWKIHPELAHTKILVVMKKEKYKQNRYSHLTLVIKRREEKE